MGWCCACGMPTVLLHLAIMHEELQWVARLWNLHRIWPSTRNNSSPHGWPCLLYQHPEIAGTVDYKHDVVIGHLDVASHMCCDDLPMDLSPEFTALAEVIMTEEGLRVPGNANEAQNLYMTLINEINKIIWDHIIANLPVPAGVQNLDLLRLFFRMFVTFCTWNAFSQQKDIP